MTDKNESDSKDKLSQSTSSAFGVVVTMMITDDTGKDVDSKKIDFGKLKLDQVRGLTELFSMMASNIEYIKKLEPLYEKLDKNKPAYLR